MMSGKSPRRPDGTYGFQVLALYAPRARLTPLAGHFGAHGRENKGLDVSPDVSDSCVMWLGPKGRHGGPGSAGISRQSTRERQTHEH